MRGAPRRAVRRPRQLGDQGRRPVALSVADRRRQRQRRRRLRSGWERPSGRDYSRRLREQSRAEARAYEMRSPPFGGLRHYLILPSLYTTCLRTTGSYFFISILSGLVFLFLSVV